STSETIAFFQSLRTPGRPLKSLFLPFTLTVFTALTLTLNRPSTACLISGLLASAATLKVTWLCSEPLVVFSVISGARITSYMRARLTVALILELIVLALIAGAPRDASRHPWSAPACRGAGCRRRWLPAAAAHRHGRCWPRRGRSWCRPRRRRSPGRT